MSKKFKFLLLVFIVIPLVSCGKPTTTKGTNTEETTAKVNSYILPELKDETISDMEQFFSNYDLVISYIVTENSQINKINTFVEYENGLLPGDDILVGSNLIIYVTPSEIYYELDKELTESLEMDFTYQGKEFKNDGVGSVTLERCVDGDTAYFNSNGFSFSLRFLGIDTPESTYRFDPWGKSASQYTCNVLENASSIVLQADGERMDGNGRYLGWVWVDSKLLNLELIEMAYSQAKGAAGLKYESIIYQAEFKVQPTKRRVWGEIDPDYDYSKEGVQITIEELVTNQEDYIGKKVVIKGIVSRTIGQHPYIQDGDYGIYLFSGFEYTSKLVLGNEVQIEGLTPTYHPDKETGALQLTGFSRKNIDVLSISNIVLPRLLTIDQITDNSIGTLIKLENLEVISVYQNQYDSAFTITAEDNDGKRITVRRDVASDKNITADLFEIGAKFDIVAPLSKYQSKHQLMIASLDDVTFK